MPRKADTGRKITLAAIGKIVPGETLWDSDLKGFCARRQRGTTISYLLKTRINGRIRWFTIGHHGAWTPDTARRRAREIMVDPLSAEKAIQEAACTFATVSDEFFKSHGPKLKPRSLEEYRRHDRLYLRPAFGHIPVADIDRGTVSRAHSSWKEKPRAANHALAIMSKIMTWAEDQGYRPEQTNPCRRIRKYKEDRRERFLKPEELRSLGLALDQVSKDGTFDPFIVGAVRLLLLTGARLNEILTLRWSDVDLSRKMIFLPDSKTGKKPILLNEPAMAVLTSLPRLAGNPHVIAGRIGGQHLVNLQKPWRAIRKIAGLDEVRIHDLRHTFASYAVAAGGSLPMIGRQLGHSQPQTTQRYAHLADDPVRRLTETTGAAIAGALREDH